MGTGFQNSMRDVCLFMMHMRNFTQSLLYCIVTILVAFVSLSEVIAAKDPNEGDQGLAEQPSVKQSEALTPSEGPKASSADLAASILRRPLFEPGRRPPAPAQAQEPVLRARPEINALIRSKISEPYQGVKVIEFDHLSPDGP